MCKRIDYSQGKIIDLTFKDQDEQRFLNFVSNVGPKLNENFIVQRNDTLYNNWYSSQKHVEEAYQVVGN